MPEGRARLDRLPSDRRAAYDESLRESWDTYPQLSGDLRLLQRGTLTVPVANWSEVHKQHVGPEGRDAYIRFLAARTARAIEAGVTGWDLSEAEVADKIRDYITGRMEADVRRQRPDRYLRNRDFIGGCEEALVSFAFGRRAFA